MVESEGEQRVGRDGEGRDGEEGWVGAGGMRREGE